MLGFAPIAASALGDDGLRVAGLIAGQITTSAPSIDNTFISQVHSLDGVSIVTGAPIVDEVVFGVELLDADIITTRPTINKPAISQDQSLSATEITSSSPTIDDAIAVINIEAVASEITASSPTLDQSTITQSHNLQFVINIGAPVVEQSRILGFAALGRVGIDGSTSVLLEDSISELML